MPDTPHIKRFEEYVTDGSRQVLDEEKFHGDTDYRHDLTVLLLKQIIEAHDDLAEHVERLAAVAPWVNNLTDTAPPVDTSTTEATHERQPEAGTDRTGPADRSQDRGAEGSQEGSP